MPLDLETGFVHVGTVLVSGVRFVVCGCSMSIRSRFLSFGPVVNLSKKNWIVLFRLQNDSSFFAQMVDFRTPIHYHS